MNARLKRHHCPVRLLVLVAMVGFSGCGAPETSTSAAPEDGERREMVLSMFAEYRTGELAGVPEIDARAVATIDPAQSVVLVDCREDYEQAVSFIPGAVSRAEFEKASDQFREHRIVVYCTIGYRSGLYTRDLIAREFDAVNLAGGVLAWAHDGGAFVAPDAAETNRVHVYGPTWDLLPAAYESVLPEDPSP